MKLQLLALSILLSLLPAVGFAISFEVLGKNGSPILRTEVIPTLPLNVGEMSVQVLETHQIPFQGSVYGISKITDLGQDIEVISDFEMKAYGWCFSIDGVIPETMPDQTPLLAEAKHIQWFYAYAHYYKGEWIGQCVRHQ